MKTKFWPHLKELHLTPETQAETWWLEELAKKIPNPPQKRKIKDNKLYIKGPVSPSGKVVLVLEWCSFPPPRRPRG